MFPCACCGYLTRSAELPGTFEICPVCGWEDDNVQLEDETYQGGANGISLEQARKNFADFGASSISSLKKVRSPFPDEHPNL